MYLINFAFSLNCKFKISHGRAYWKLRVWNITGKEQAGFESCLVQISSSLKSFCWTHKTLQILVVFFQNKFLRQNLISEWTLNDKISLWAPFTTFKFHPTPLPVEKQFFNKKKLGFWP